MSDYPFCRVSYWRKHDGVTTACGPEGIWTECRITPISGHTSYDRDRLLSLLQSAYNAGQRDAKKEVRKVLGV